MRARWSKALGLCALSAACGDVGDAQIPLPLAGLEAAPTTPRDSAVILLDASDPEATCGTVAASLPVMLPGTSATSTLSNGEGERLVTGGDAQVTCRVSAASPDPPDAFDVELEVVSLALPRFELRGSVIAGQTATLTLTLALSASDSDPLEAECSGDVRAALPGALWWPTATCAPARRGEVTTDCVLQGGVIFENCTP